MDERPHEITDDGVYPGAARKSRERVERRVRACLQCPLVCAMSIAMSVCAPLQEPPLFFDRVLYLWPPLGGVEDSSRDVRLIAACLGARLLHLAPEGNVCVDDSNADALCRTCGRWDYAQEDSEEVAVGGPSFVLPRSSSTAAPLTLPVPQAPLVIPPGWRTSVSSVRSGDGTGARSRVSKEGQPSAVSGDKRTSAPAEPPVGAAVPGCAPTDLVGACVCGYDPDFPEKCAAVSQRRRRRHNRNKPNTDCNGLYTDAVIVAYGTCIASGVHSCVCDSDVNCCCVVLRCDRREDGLGHSTGYPDEDRPPAGGCALADDVSVSRGGAAVRGPHDRGDTDGERDRQ